MIETGKVDPLLLFWVRRVSVQGAPFTPFPEFQPSSSVLILRFPSPSFLFLSPPPPQPEFWDKKHGKQQGYVDVEIGDLLMAEGTLTFSTQEVREGGGRANVQPAGSA